MKGNGALLAWMKFDMKKPIIYTSEYLRTTKNTAGVAEAIHNALESLQIKHRELKFTKDYWCRDYMPVMISEDGTYSKYQYSPDYLVENERYQQYITNQDDVCRELNIFTPTNMNIVFDGGNYVRCDNKVLMTDKIFMENPQCKLTYLLNHLERSLCAEVVLLPWDMQDECGHADGMVTYMGDGRVLLNSCWKKKSKDFHKRLVKILGAHFEVVELDYNCKEDKDSWCYLNYLKLPNAILLPCLSENIDCDNDLAAIETFGKLFPDLSIIPIYAMPLISKGGALHCVTWEYIEKDDESLP